MNEIRTNIRFVAALAGNLLLVSLLCGCDKKTNDAAAIQPLRTTSLLSDQALTAYQTQLLDLAFNTASAIPVQPHIKDRCKAQEAVVAACLKLDQPRRALGYIERIDDWRRGLAYADLALYGVRHGAVEESQRYLQLAGQISGTENLETWRSDTIKARIAQTYAWMGHQQQAETMEAGLETPESGKVAGIQAIRSEPGLFDEQIVRLDHLIASGQFDTIRNALEAYARLFDRFYADPKRRSLLEEKIMASMTLLPALVRIELLMSLATVAQDHHDPAKALEFVTQSHQLLDSAQWRPEHRVALMAQLAVLRFRAGDQNTAITERGAALAFYETNRSSIVNIYRATALRRLAEAYQSMGDTDRARSVYQLAVEEGMDNPNSRPRAEDLSATCCSMALNAVEPDAKLWMRLRQIHDGLRAPW
jgi:tetratricopeptide (TPR) repeat protein